ncbi:hypothetical protein [Pelotalea chapellei]|uniref:Uncharacterized protein n=1 Tax=Pelotalea chapellei TaxID=44671 RepID=A0ABS5U4B1_9BACT|nr:hypothetical protein [Pelotalea chapellei]MBT1070495.1 hypothetical protein [Pelotalea chapellei]
MEKKLLLMMIAAALAVPVSALAEVSVNVNVGVPGAVVVPAPLPRPRVMVPAPPSIRFEAPPLFLAPPQLGFYLGVDVPYDIFFSGDNYYLYYGNSWYRSDFYNGPWIVTERRHLPPGLRKHRVEYIRSYKDREYRAYDRQRDHYRGRHFRPEHVRGEHGEQRRGREDWKEERKHEKREMKEERRREKEEWKEERRGHGRRD